MSWALSFPCLLPTTTADQSVLPSTPGVRKAASESSDKQSCTGPRLRGSEPWYLACVKLPKSVTLSQKLPRGGYAGIFHLKNCKLQGPEKTNVRVLILNPAQRKADGFPSLEVLFQRPGEQEQKVKANHNHWLSASARKSSMWEGRDSAPAICFSQEGRANQLTHQMGQAQLVSTMLLQLFSLPRTKTDPCQNKWRMEALVVKQPLSAQVSL